MKNVNIVGLISKKANSPFFTGETLRSIDRLTDKKTIVSELKKEIELEQVWKLKKDLYCINEKYWQRPSSQYEVALLLEGDSYVTGLAALSYYGLIPEAIFTTTCFSSNEKSYVNKFGSFFYSKVPPHFLKFGVENKNRCRMSTPLKAILDYAWQGNHFWQNRGALLLDLRIDEEDSHKINFEDLIRYEEAYKNKKMTKICEALRE